MYIKKVMNYFYKLKKGRVITMKFKKLWPYALSVTLVAIFGCVFVVMDLHKEENQVTSRTMFEIMSGKKPEYTKVDTSKALSKQTRDIKIGDHYFRIPLAYIDAALEPGLEQDGVLLVFFWPDFTPRAGFKSKADYEKAWN